jgi:universal stress protein F
MRDWLFSNQRKRAMYQTIVVPVDVSNSDKAGAMLETAQKLGGGSAKIILTNIVEEIPSYIAAQIPDGYGKKAQANAVDELTRIAKSAGSDAEIVVSVGHASRGILDVADEKKADAIIIASHRPGFQDYFLGSTASRVVRHAKCSVVVLR